MQHIRTTNAANRLDRLPISRFHKTTLLAVAFAYFFEFADINTFAITAPVVREQWGTDVNHIAYVTSTSFVGMFIGAVVAGGLADRLGRKRTLTGTTLWFTLWSFACVFAWDIWSLGVFRVLSSAGLSAMTVVAVVYISELFPSAKRGKFQAYAIVVGICGTPVTNLIASAVVPLSDWSWRLVYLWGALGVFFLLLVRKLEESPQWLESRGRHEEAEATLARIEASATAEHGPLPEARAPEPQGPVVRPGLRMLKDRKFLYPTLLLSVLWVTQTIGFFGYSSWAPTLLAAEGVSVEDSIFYVALTTVGAPLGSFLAAMVTDRFERKWTLAVFGLVIAASGLMYGLTFTPVLIVVFGFLVNLFERGYTALAYAYAPELYNTSGRSLGTSIAYGLGRLSNAAGPLMIAGIYNGVGYEAVFMFIAGTWTVGALVLAVFGPATRRQRLAAEAAAQPQPRSVTTTS
ncbi:MULTISPECIES: MFS transporter [unclassified Streptomyces]|uniref:MFS transporter n=1 Tax=Streptomyces TaxID=1883 RepID=UPI0001C18B17|nr:MULTISPECIES: MFS transporter [unclassified Streptomyces]MYR68404.1 MFS transporter [Streptomyces sp. SID4939]MYS02108.1 MFS transporter [Streptomyces sp. SID4940]MYT66759.1 MFS transporter [Streptomyces sp. SID8357]MYT83680.1 MFS transporter [Streptomyces sp. SID8360]MYU34393.1 MFS transporter [Streptomyces sp. SID8358]MYW35589.1 MFS transporter [Streptomyces sp. SID1]MYX72622.1 MFS transporter [Streptomyces sp. SID3915]